jgi:putative ABC transport system permease protein
MTRAFRSVLTALILRPILREKIRTSLTVVGIAVGVAVIVAIQLANQSALRAFRESIDAVSGRANYQISSDSGEVNESVLLQLQPLWAEGLRFAPVIDIEGLLEPSETPIRILGVDLLSDLQFRDYRYARVLTGSNQQRSGASSTEIASFFELFRPDSIVLPAPFAREHRLGLGSPVTISVLGNRRTMIVRGILEAKGPATAFNGAIAVCDIATAQEAFGLRGRLSRIDLLLPDERAERIAARLHAQLPAGTRIERPSRRNDRVEKMLRAFRVNLFALAGVALLVGVFLVYNTVLISILRRRRDIGIAKTLGVTPRQIFFIFLAEGAVFGAAGSILGVGLGVLLARGVLDLVGRTINALYVSTPPQSVELTPSVALLGMAVGVVLSMIASMQPSFEASRVPPNVMIRPGLHQRISARSEWQLALAALATFIIAALFTRLHSIGGIAVGGYISVLFVVAGFSLLAPSIVRWTCALLARPLHGMFGVVGKLAASSLPGSLRRTAVAAAALALATGMMVAVALMVGSFRETVRVWVDQTVSSDLWLRPAKGLGMSRSALFPPEIVDELRKVPFLRGVDPVRGRDIVYRDSIVNVGSGEFRVAAQFSTMPMIAPRTFREGADAALKTGGVFVSESFSLRFEKGVGDTIEIPVANGSMRVPIVAVYRDYSNDRGVIVMDRALYIRAFDDRAINTVVLFLKPGTDRDQARRYLERTFGPKYHAFTVSNSEIKTEVMKIFDQTFMITYALLFVAIIVAVLGIVNTLAALILERTRELALLRVTGMTPADIRRMLLIESSILGIASTASGVVMGYALSWILINVINKQSFGWTIEFHAPVRLIVTSLIVTLVSSALAGLVPARLANRISMVSSIKS